MKKLYDYQLYREFLRDSYLHMKALDPQFSYSKFAKLANINSPNYLKLIIDGTRDLTISNIHQFAKALKLTEAEVDFFETLVLYEQASTPIEKKYYRSRMIKLKEGRADRQGKIRIKNLAEFPYLPAILVACNGLNYEEAGQNLSERFKIPIGTIKKILEKLLQEKVIEIENSCLKLASDYYIQYDALRSNSDQKHFLRSHLELSKRALERRYSKDAQFFAHTFTASPERMSGFIKKIADLLETLTVESNEDPPQNTLQLNIQFFPLEES